MSHVFTFRLPHQPASARHRGSFFVEYRELVHCLTPFLGAQPQSAVMLRKASQINSVAASEHGLLGAVEVAMERGAIRRPLRLLARGVRDGLPKR